MDKNLIREIEKNINNLKLEILRKQRLLDQLLSKVKENNGCDL